MLEAIASRLEAIATRLSFFSSQAFFQSKSRVLKPAKLCTVGFSPKVVPASYLFLSSASSLNFVHIW